MVGSDFQQFGSIGGYVKNGKLYRCPADKSTVTYNGSVYDRARSVSMNGWVGYATRDWMQPASGSVFKLNYKMGDMLSPGPSQTWVLIDERENSINDGWFAVDMVDTGANTTWVDLPATWHNHGAVLSFGDGHAEYKKWMDANTLAAGLTPNTGCPNNQDIAWLQQRTTGSQ
jgi:prepilin-type processing-associated H-X9-DG protein